MNVLVIDDEAGIREVVRRAMVAKHYDCQTAADGAAALALAREQHFDLVFCDVLMQGMSGMEVLAELRKLPGFDGEIVIMTGQASVEAAIQAVAGGADDFISKPFDFKQLQAIAAATEQRRAPADLIDIPPSRASIQELRGHSAAIIEVVKTIMRVAASDLPVMITGETGTGKELAARLIHRSSPRAQKPFIALNCGALPDSLLESELFGHVRGAFTGADLPRRGVFEEANGGTILLDEISETSPAFQIKLLRVLEAREITPLGSSHRKPIDVRVLSASNRSQQELSNAASFRPDLLFRLQGINIRMPSLRERREDIKPIAMSFLSEYAPAAGGLRITRDALAALEAFDWPGNVRQLRHVCQRAASLSREVIRPCDLPEHVVKGHSNAAVKELLPDTAAAAWPTLEEMEARYLNLLRATFGDNKTKIATILGVDRKTVYRMFERLGSATGRPLTEAAGTDSKSA